jgi:hypothetical protein
MIETFLSRRSVRGALLLGLAASSLATRAAAQHEGHQSMAPMPMDTLATAPTTPSRSVGDSAIVADSLLVLCRSHTNHSLDAYSSCIGDGIAALSSAGNIPRNGVLDRVMHAIHV